MSERIHIPLIENHSSSGSSTPSGVRTPLRHTTKSLRPYVYALMAFKHGRKFQTHPSVHRTRRLSEVVEREGKFAAALTVSPVHFSPCCAIILIDHRYSM